MLYKMSVAETGKTTVVTFNGIQAVATKCVCTVVTNLASLLHLRWRMGHVEMENTLLIKTSEVYGQISSVCWGKHHSPEHTML